MSKELRMMLRLSEAERQELEALSRVLNLNKAAVIRLGLAELRIKYGVASAPQPEPAATPKPDIESVRKAQRAMDAARDKRKAK